jgi:hypothetical protein
VKVHCTRSSIEFPRKQFCVLSGFAGDWVLCGFYEEMKMAGNIFIFYLRLNAMNNNNMP